MAHKNEREGTQKEVLTLKDLNQILLRKRIQRLGNLCCLLCTQ